MTVMQQIDPAAVELSHEEVQRYSRHLIMPEVGMTGQKKLKAASVLLIGAGGLGSPLAMYLAAGWYRPDWAGGLRCGRLHQSAATNHPRNG